ncbi:MAG: ABC transporter ATP-binding protein [Magnetospiraceae bacterium]
MSDAALQLSGVTRTFKQGGGGTLDVLRGIDFTIQKGELVALVGPSGAGKSTLLHIAGLLEKPSSGAVLINGEDCSGASDSQRTMVRRQQLGFVYQYHHLLAEFTAEENVAMPRIIAGISKSEAQARARDLLDRMGLGERLTHRPGELSGGEQQRVAIARALANEPALLLADEPTGNLDPETADSVFKIMVERVRDQGLAALIATHNPDMARRMDRTVQLQTGTLIEL